MTTNVIQIQSGVSVASQLASWFKAVNVDLKNWNQKRRAKADLRDLPDYLLADIGINRYEIDSFVEGRGLANSDSVEVSYGRSNSSELVA